MRPLPAFLLVGRSAPASVPRAAPVFFLLASGSRGPTHGTAPSSQAASGPVPGPTSRPTGGPEPRPTPVPRRPADDWAAISARKGELAAHGFHCKYGRVKSADLRDLGDFLLSLPPDRAYGAPMPVTLDTCVGEHVIDYVVARTLRPTVRTVVHRPACPGGTACDCPRTLAYSSLHSLVFRLQAAFHDIGRSAKAPLGYPLLTNPCTERCVQIYLRRAR